MKSTISSKSSALRVVWKITLIFGNGPQSMERTSSIVDTTW